ncbi:hypothetical protein O6H91_08G004300 [Diphasiastrum complanatum]|uniref:Uncharacterized protein n=1 Tax=Diphasiastrum complanatum TaxID=34168 RepID=A0ACC2CUH0_DIPCM|nr:hypothetical protein O6H91_08G004300 [Diphasiastrum complanatum]
MDAAVGSVRFSWLPIRDGFSVTEGGKKKHAWDLISDAENLSFIERLVKALHILFPQKRRSKSNADIAKQRLKMILISDRCSVSDEAKRKIVTNIIGALSDFVEIESEEKVQLNVTTDPLLGTIYAVTIPVRRVKPEYQDYNKEPKEVHSDEALKEFRMRFE